MKRLKFALVLSKRVKFFLSLFASDTFEVPQYLIFVKYSVNEMISSIGRLFAPFLKISIDIRIDRSRFYFMCFHRRSVSSEVDARL